MMERMRESMSKLELTDDQKKRIEEVLADMRPKFQEMRGQAGGDRDQMREKMQPLIQEMRERIGQVLTEEQKQKLPEIMQGGGGFGGRDGGPGKPRDRKNTTAPAKGDKGDQANAGGSSLMESGEVG